MQTDTAPNSEKTPLQGISVKSRAPRTADSFREAVKNRLPGGNVFHAADPRIWDTGYGIRVTALRIAHCLGVFFFGTVNIKKRPVAPLRPPYPALYHFSAAANRESILENGLLPGNGKVWLTDRIDPLWLETLKRHQESGETVCFCVDVGRLVALGHSVEILNSFHEFRTDRVPPECLRACGEEENGEEITNI